MELKSDWIFKFSKDEATMSLQAGTKLFAVVDRLDTGTSGPYFYEPGLAIFWHFHKSLVSMLPSVADAMNMDVSFKIDNHVEVIDGKMVVFGGGNWQLLEYSVPQGVTLEFGSTMIDGNPVKNVYYPYGNGTSELTHVNITPSSYTTILKQRLAIKNKNDVFYYGMLGMISPAWYKQGFLREASFETLENIFKATKPLFKKDNGMSAYTNITAVGIYIKHPQDMFELRTLYSIRWDLVWKRFLSLRHRESDVEQVRQDFKSLASEWIYPSHVQRRPPAFDINVIVQIATQIEELKDLVAFGTNSNFYVTRVYRSERNHMFQQLVLRKFLPCWSESFGLLKDQALNQDVLGAPVCKGNLLWSINSILFREDIPLDVAPINIEDYNVNIQKKSRQDASRFYPGRRGELLVIADENMEFIAMTRKLTQIKSPKAFLELTRQCNSFILMFALHWASSNFSAISLPENVGVQAHMHGEAGHLKFISSRVVHPPMANAFPDGPLKLFGSSMTVDPDQIINSIGRCKSWMNEILTPSFFLDPTFNAKLNQMKILEKQRYKLQQYPIEQIIAGGAKYQSARFDALRHKILFYREELLIGYLEIALRGVSSIKIDKNPTPDQFRIEFFDCVVLMENVDEEFKTYFTGEADADGVSSSIIRRLQWNYFQTNHSAKLSYVFPDEDAWKSLAPEVASSKGNSSVLKCSTHRPGNGANAFYPTYMTLCSLIRMFLFYGHSDRAVWATSF